MIVFSLSLFCVPVRAAGIDSASDSDSTRYLGDVDFDGNVTAGDARLVLRQSVDLEHLIDESLFYADYDANGSVTSADARMILRTSVLLEPLVYPGEREQPTPIISDNPEPEKQCPEVIKNRWLVSFCDSVDYDELASDMYWLVDEIGVRSWWDDTQNHAADLLYDRLRDIGFTEDRLKTQEFTHGGIMGRNIMAVVPTVAETPEIILIMAHYDTARGTGGAVDNASGTVALLQLARLFNDAEQDFGAELRFLFTAGEEQGYYGAYAYVGSLTRDETERHRFVFNIDMAGKPNDLYEPGRAYYLCVSTEPVSTDGYDAPAAAENAGSIAVAETKTMLGDLGEDGFYEPVRAVKHDIVPFRKAGIEALTLSWRCISSARSEGADYDLATPYYAHTSEDDLYYFDLPSLYHTTRLITGATAQLLFNYHQ